MVKWDDPALLEDPDPAKQKKKTLVIVAIVAGVLLAAVVGIFLATRGPSLTPEELKVFEEAQAALRTDDYEKYPAGEQKLLDLAQKYPNHVPSLAWLIQLYCAWGDVLKSEADTFQRAAQAKARELQDLKKTIEATKSKSTKEEAEKRFVAAKVELDDLNKAGKIKDLAGTQKLREAKTWANKASHVGGDDPQLQRAMADHARIGGKWPDVESRLTYVQKHKPSSAGYRFIKGAMLMERDKKHDDAIALFEEALQVDPAFTKAAYYLALAWHLKGDKEKAVAAMKKVLEMSPGHQGAKTYMGVVPVMEAARAAAAQAELAGTDQEQVATGDEVGGADPKAEDPKKAAPPAEKQDKKKGKKKK
jgi:tetratricopeptide (TPR) repeat protein